MWTSYTVSHPWMLYVSGQPVASFLLEDEGLEVLQEETQSNRNAVLVRAAKERG